MSDDFARRVQTVREELRKRLPKGTWRAAAPKMGVTNSALSDFLNGKTASPTEENLVSYEAWLAGVPVRSDTREQTEYDKHLEWLRQQAGSLESKTAHLREVRGGIRDDSLRFLAVAVLRAEDNAALLSQERTGHRDAILRGDEDEAVRPGVVRSVVKDAGKVKGRRRSAGAPPAASDAETPAQTVHS